MRQCSLYQKSGGCLFTVPSLGASPVELNYYSLMLPSVLLTAMANFTIEFVKYVTYDTFKRLKKHLAIPPTGIQIYNHIHDTTATGAFVKQKGIRINRKSLSCVTNVFLSRSVDYTEICQCPLFLSKVLNIRSSQSESIHSSIPGRECESRVVSALNR
jgi:hypothetical protein